VVLVNFWTLTCINWLRQEPYVRAWARAYRDDGLIVLGIHTPEFAFESEPERVRLAVQARDIDYPVALDNDYAIWRGFDNHYWPALYFVDTDGVIRDRHFGEGRYTQSEGVLQRLLGVQREAADVTTHAVELAADWNHLKTPETYLGYRRTARSALPPDAAVDTSRTYQLPQHLAMNRWGLAGEWTIGPERAVLDAAGGSIAMRYHARDAHLVMSAGKHPPIPFRVLLDGQPPADSHGVDVVEDGNGLLHAGRMYQLVRQPGPVSDQTVEITFREPGAEAYAFTFG
jgi:hypothetical protein